MCENLEKQRKNLIKESLFFRKWYRNIDLNIELIEKINDKA